MGDDRRGILDSLRQLLDSALQLLQVRLSLLGNELEEQKLRLAQGLVFGLLGALLATVALVLACGWLVTLFWEQRAVVLGLLLAGVGAAAGVLLVAAHRSLRSTAAMFQASMQELAADRATLAQAARDLRRP